MRLISISAEGAHRNTQPGTLAAYAAAPDQDIVDDYTLDFPVATAPPAPATVDLPTAQPVTEVPPADSQAGRVEVPLDPAPGAAGEIGVGSLLRGRYQLTQQIGVGGFSLIFAAMDRHRQNVGSDAPVVTIKLLKPEFRSAPQAAQRLKREFARLEALSHPNIRRAFDIDHDGDVWFLVLEFFAGQTLSTYLNRQSQRPLARAQALEIIRACGDALDFAHRQGVLHCDLKPGNILISPLNEVRVIDFGSGYDQSVSVISPSQEDGDPRQATPAYASPEALSGAPPDMRDDVFSFAAVTYELLAGKRLQAAPDRPKGLDNLQWQLLSQSLSPIQADRPLSLRPLLDVFKPNKKPGRSWPLLAATAGLVGVVLFGIANFGSDVLPVPAPRQFLLNEPDGGLATPSGAEPATGTDSLDGAGTIKSAESVDPTFEVAPTITRNSPRAVPLTLISLDQPVLNVRRPTAMAAMIVQRSSGPERRARILWRTLPGTALPGVDYTPVDDGIVQFADNQNLSSLYVPLLSGNGVAAERTFYIEISSDTRQVGVGPIARVAVNIDSQIQE